MYYDLTIFKARLNIQYVKGEGRQKVQTSSHQINKSWGYNIQYGDSNKLCCILYLEVVMY